MPASHAAAAQVSVPPGGRVGTPLPLALAQPRRPLGPGRQMCVEPSLYHMPQLLLQQRLLTATLKGL